jgi:hypothetical protein
MLTTFFLVDCDRCGQQAEKMAMWFDSVQDAGEAVSCLTVLLQQQGWHVFRQTYTCPSCSLDHLHAEHVVKSN